MSITWQERQKRFKNKRTGLGHHYNDNPKNPKRTFTSKEQKRLHQQRHFHGLPDKGGLTKSERNAKVRADKAAKNEGRLAKHIRKLKNKLKGTADLKKKDKINKKIKRLEN